MLQIGLHGMPHVSTLFQDVPSVMVWERHCKALHVLRWGLRPEYFGSPRCPKSHPDVFHGVSWHANKMHLLYPFVCSCAKHFVLGGNSIQMEWQKGRLRTPKLKLLLSPLESLAVLIALELVACKWFKFHMLRHLQSRETQTKLLQVT